MYYQVHRLLVCISIFLVLSFSFMSSHVRAEEAGTMFWNGDNNSIHGSPNAACASFSYWSSQYRYTFTYIYWNWGRCDWYGTNQQGVDVGVHYQNIAGFFDQYMLVDPGANDYFNQCNLVGNPIDPVPGNKYQKESLIRVDATHPLVFDIYYNSKRSERWRHTYSRSVKKASSEDATRFDFTGKTFGNEPFIHESNGFFDAANISSIYGDKYTMGGSAFNTRNDACVWGWANKYKYRYHYSWISGSTAEYINGGKCKIKDSQGNQRMIFDVYGLYSGRPAFTSLNLRRYLRFTHANGNMTMFSRMSITDPWGNESNTGERVEDLFSGVDQIGYRFYTSNDTIEDYDLQGHLLSIQFADGHVQSLIYDSETGVLNRVQNETGEYLNFIYQTFGLSDQYIRLQSITDNAGRSWGFRYSDANNLEYVDNPDGTSRRYHYENTKDKRLLTGITDERNMRYATWTYDTKGRANSSAHGGMANIDKTEIAYIEGSYGFDLGRRTVTSTRTSSITSESTTIVSNYKIHGGGSRSLVAEITGPGCSSCGTGQTKYEHDSNTGYLLYKIEHGIRTEYGNYDTKGNPGYIIEAAGTADTRRKDYTYDPRYHSKPATITEASVFSGANKVTTFSYDDFGNITSESINGFKPDGTPVNRTTTYQYEGPYHQLSQVDGPRTGINDVLNFNYYPNDPLQGYNRARLSSVTGPDGNYLRSNITYTATGKIDEESRANGLQIDYGYYPGNDRLQYQVENDTINNQTRTTAWTYLPTGEVRTITQASGTLDETQLTLDYDDARRLTRITDGLGNYIEYMLDSVGNVEREAIHDASGYLKKTLSQTFDSYNRLDNFSETNQVTNYDYNTNGTLDKTTDGKGVVTDYSYDNLKRLTRVTQDLNGTDVNTANALTQYGYDVQDNLTSVIDANNGTTSFVYDDLGNLTSQTSPDTGTTTFSHDEAGNILTKTDAKGQVFGYTYDAYNRLINIDAPHIIDDVKFTYDTCQQGYGRLCKVERHLGTTGYMSEVSYRYNAMGDVTGTDQNVITWQSYNQATNSVAYTYDGASRIKTITYPSGAVVTYSYDVAGQVNNVQLNQDGAITNLFNVANRYPFGPVNNAIYGNSESYLGELHDDYRIAIKQGSQQFTNLNYDLNGNPILMSYPQGSSTLDYDAHNRLDTVTGTLGSFDYDYDKVGNKTQQIKDGVTTGMGYDSNSNRMNSLDGSAITVDANGNVTNIRGMALSYSADNRLKSVNTGVAFDYNGLGQRSIKQTTAPGTAGGYGYSQSKVFVYGLNGELLAEMGPTGKVVKEYIYIAGEPLAMLDYKANSSEGFLNGDMDGDGAIDVSDYIIWYFNHYQAGDITKDVTGDGPLNTDDTNLLVGCAINQGSCEAASYSASLYYIHNDHLGTPKMLTDETGAVVWQAVATPFGKASVNNDVDGNGVVVEMNLRQPGQYYDRETGFYYNYFRYYDPTTGRYITSDPIGLAGGINTYAYVRNNPLSAIDPSGLMETIGIKIAGGVISPLVNRIKESLGYKVNAFDHALNSISAGSSAAAIGLYAQGSPAMIYGIGLSSSFMAGWELGQAINKLELPGSNKTVHDGLVDLLEDMLSKDKNIGDNQCH